MLVRFVDRGKVRFRKVDFWTDTKHDQRLSSKLDPKFNRTTTRYAISQIESGKTTEENLDNTIFFITFVFRLFGKDSTVANEYICNHCGLLAMNQNDINDRISNNAKLINKLVKVSGLDKEACGNYIMSNFTLLLEDQNNILKRLSVLDIIGLSNEAFFIHSELLSENINLYQLYAVVKELQGKENLDIEDVVTLLNTKDRNSYSDSPKLSESKSMLLSKNFERRIERKLD